MNRSGLIQGFSLVLLGALAVSVLSVSALATKGTSTEPTSQASEPNPPGIRYETKLFPRYRVTQVTVPAGKNPGKNYAVIPLGQATLKTLEQSVKAEQPLVAINGGFFDPRNQKTTAHLQTTTYTEDPSQNEGLTENPNLAKYLPTIFNQRPEWRTYQCSTGYQYTIASHDEADKVQTKDTCKRVGVLGAGPNLLPVFDPQAEAFTDRNPQGKIIRDPLGVNSPNARSAVGLKQNGDVILMMVAQRPDITGASGVSLFQLRSLMNEAGAVQALALDGGSSSAIYVSPLVGGPGLIYGKWTRGKSSGMKAQPVVRPLKSILAVVAQ